MRIAAFVASFCAFLVMTPAIPADGGDGLPTIREVPKPGDAVPARRPRTQPSVPDAYREVPFVETAAEPVLTSAEKARGYMLFQRPITEPVYSNTRPLPFERLAGLVAFATPGEFEPVTFGIYPIRDLVNFKVRASALLGPDGAVIPASDLKVRLVTYWSIGYPSYESRTTYRRLPELLESVTVATTPARECQRYWITLSVGDHTPPGLYHGTVTLWDDGFDKAVEIPLALRVLPFRLVRDGGKHYSVYYELRNSSQYDGRDEAFFRKASANEYRAMKDYGIDMVPTFTLRLDSTGKMALDHAEELDRMLALGMTGPVPVTADDVISRIYRDTTPGAVSESHWRLTKQPTEAFYRKVTDLFKGFDEERKARGWPAFVCCPVDEVDPESADFGCKVYKAVHDAGIRTYATKDPVGADAHLYAPYIDVWCSQPYSMPYEKIAAQKRYEYWSYPNHIAGEVKDSLVMCKGGRMTYGYGLWRSGYTTLIPWHWAWTTDRDQFEYLRGRRSGCGNRIDDDGEIIPAVYWECFREGRDDEGYVYTLEQAAWEREGSDNGDCRREVAAAHALLQETWDAINVQQKYLAQGMWPSDEFDARRWKLAKAIEKLLMYPSVRKGFAPSVTVADTASKMAGDDDVLAKPLDSGQAKALNLMEGSPAWQSAAREGKVEQAKDAGRGGRTGLRWKVKIDYKHDGEFSGKYPVGWPSVSRHYDKGGLDMTGYDYLEFFVRVDSNRDEVSDDSTPIGVCILSHGVERHLFETKRDIGDRQRQWVPLRFALSDLVREGGLGPAPWKDISEIRLFISESDYRDGMSLTIDIGDARLVAFKSPTVTSVVAPRVIVLPRSRLAVPFDLLGAPPSGRGVCTMTASMTDAAGIIRAETRQDLAEGRLAVLDTSPLDPGRYALSVKVSAADGTILSQSTCSIECLPGPLAKEDARPGNRGIESSAETRKPIP